MHARGRVCAYVLELFGTGFGRSRGTRDDAAEALRLVQTVRRPLPVGHSASAATRGTHCVGRYPWDTVRRPLPVGHSASAATRGTQCLGRYPWDTLPTRSRCCTSSCLPQSAAQTSQASTGDQISSRRRTSARARCRARFRAREAATSATRRASAQPRRRPRSTRGAPCVTPYAMRHVVHAVRRMAWCGPAHSVHSSAAIPGE